jgi:hypothetical protein
MIHTMIMTVCWFCILCGIILGIGKLISLMFRGLLIAIAWCVVPREKPQVLAPPPVQPYNPHIYNFSYRPTGIAAKRAALGALPPLDEYPDQY